MCRGSRINRNRPDPTESHCVLIVTQMRKGRLIGIGLPDEVPRKRSSQRQREHVEHRAQCFPERQLALTSPAVGKGDRDLSHF